MPCRKQHQLRMCKRVLQQWRGISSLRGLLQQQGRAAARSLGRLRLRQWWQLWQRWHRCALGARQRQYSKMVYDLLKVAAWMWIWMQLDLAAVRHCVGPSCW